MSIFKEKTVWITGASSGIGEAMAYEAAKRGAKVVISGRRVELLNKIAENIKALNAQVLVVPLDLEQPDEFITCTEKVKNKFDSIDFLINNGGISQRSLSYETAPEVVEKLMNVNFFGTVKLTQTVVQLMRRQQSGHISVISSMAGKYGFPLRSSYCASKHALQGYFEAMRFEVKNENIKVLIVSPGRVNTEISKSALKSDGTEHGKIDEGQKNGVDVNVCARKIMDAIAAEKKELLIGKKEVLLYYIHKFFPWLYYKIVEKVSAT